MQKWLVIQTAFIGDVVLATSLIESLHEKYPNDIIDVLVRKGNEGLLEEHPFVRKVLVWDKKSNKYKNWWTIFKAIRAQRYEGVINVQRYAATGLWTGLSKAKMKIGFDKNPFSFLCTHVIVHQFSAEAQHEINRNHALLNAIAPMILVKPKLYPTALDRQNVLSYQQQPYICIAPASVWYTKQLPLQKWLDLIENIPFNGPIYIIGGPGDKLLGDHIIRKTTRKQVLNLCGRFSFLASAALQEGALLNYVNDSAPMHFASAMNAPVVAVYASTVPSFGYGPLSDTSFIVETATSLTCRPCGLHGKKQCPLKHFDCAQTIPTQQLVAPYLQVTQH
jgi:heptosyltransferase-2